MKLEGMVIGQMIPIIKCFRYLAGYTRESAVPFTGLDIYQEVAKIKVGSYVGLADSKWALVNNNILNMDVSNLQ